MKKHKNLKQRLLSLVLVFVMCLGMVDTAFAEDGESTPEGAAPPVTESGGGDTTGGGDTSGSGDTTGSNPTLTVEVEVTRDETGAVDDIGKATVTDRPTADSTNSTVDYKLEGGETTSSEPSEETSSEPSEEKVTVSGNGTSTYTPGDPSKTETDDKGRPTHEEDGTVTNTEHIEIKTPETDITPQPDTDPDDTGPDDSPGSDSETPADEPDWTYVVIKGVDGKPLRDKDGNVIYAVDEEGNRVHASFSGNEQQFDFEKKQQQKRDEDGNLMYDENGNPIYESVKDENGNPIISPTDGKKGTDLTINIGALVDALKPTKPADLTETPGDGESGEAPGEPLKPTWKADTDAEGKETGTYSKTDGQTKATWKTEEATDDDGNVIGWKSTTREETTETGTLSSNKIDWAPPEEAARQEDGTYKLVVTGIPVMS